MKQTYEMFILNRREIGTILRKARERAQFSVDTLADKIREWYGQDIDFDQRKINRWERGEVIFPPEIGFVLSEILGISLDALMVFELSTAICDEAPPVGYTFGGVFFMHSVLVKTWIW